MNHPEALKHRWCIAGYSLVEMIIVLAISGLMIGAMLQAMMGIRQYASTAEVQDDLNIEAQRIFAIIREDLGASGWYLPMGKPSLSTNDRGDLFFPYVQAQQNGKLGTRFPHHNRLAYTAKDWVTVSHYPGMIGGVADWNAPTLSLALYNSSFYAPSQEIIYLKVLRGAFDPAGIQKPLLPIDFNDGLGVTYATAGNHAQLGIRTMSQWDVGTEWDAAKGLHYLKYGSTGRIYDADASGLWLRPEFGSEGVKMPLRWETMTRYPNMMTIGISAPCIDLREIREYSFAVVPNPTAGNRGQLVRAYKKPISPITDSAGNVTPAVAASDWVISSGNYQPDTTATAMPSAMVVERVISDKVDRITFDTFRTDRLPNPNFPASSAVEFISGLEINQIRVRIFLSKRGTVDIGAAQHLVVEATLSMRSTSDTNAINDIGSQLGDGGTVIVH